MPRILLPIGFCAVGGVLLVVAIVLWTQTREFEGRARRVEGVVVALETRTSTDSGPSYAPVVEYRPGDGPPARFVSNVGASPPRYRVGDRATVLLDPEGRAAPVLDEPASIWLLPAVFGGIGAVFLLVGTVMGLIFGVR